MGYIIYIFEFFPPADLIQIQYWPWMLGIVSAAITAVILGAIKIHHKREMFYQFHVITVGAILFFISGCLFLNYYGK